MELRITEMFLSIQGESSHAGRPCSFVRLTGCPMRCVWCDSEYTFTGGEKIPFDEILAQLEEFGCNLVEVTGGEPLAQKAVFPFITMLCDLGYEVSVDDLRTVTDNFQEGELSESKLESVAGGGFFSDLGSALSGAAGAVSGAVVDTLKAIVK